jgi:hypothetical protein
MLDSALKSAGAIRPNDVGLASAMVADSLLSGKSTGSPKTAQGGVQGGGRTPESGSVSVKSPTASTHNTPQ